MLGQDAPNHVLIDFQTEYKAKLLCDSAAAPALLRLLVSTMATTSSSEGPLGPGLPRRFGENSCRYLRFTNAAWKARRVEGFSTTAERTSRLGPMKSVHSPAMMRSIGRRLGARSRLDNERIQFLRPTSMANVQIDPGFPQSVRDFFAVIKA